MAQSFDPACCFLLQGLMEFDALEQKLGQLESELLELNANSDRLHRSHNELLELQVGSSNSRLQDGRPRACEAGLGRGCAGHLCFWPSAGPGASWASHS